MCEVKQSRLNPCESKPGILTRFSREHWVATRMAHAKPIQTTIAFARVFGYTHANNPYSII